VVELLQKTKIRIGRVEKFSNTAIELVMRELAEELELGLGKLIHPLRLALTGRSVSPSMFEVMELLGKQKVLARITTACEYIQKNQVEN
jgi:glutamyl-tRNA synthetase